MDGKEAIEAFMQGIALHCLDGVRALWNAGERGPSVILINVSRNGEELETHVIDVMDPPSDPGQWEDFAIAAGLSAQCPVVVAFAPILAHRIGADGGLGEPVRGVGAVVYMQQIGADSRHWGKYQAIAQADGATLGIWELNSLMHFAGEVDE